MKNRNNKFSKNRINLFVTLVLTIGLLFSACEDPIEVTYPDGDSFTVIEAIIDNTGNQSVRVTRSKGANDTGAIPTIDDATVTVSDDLGMMYSFTSIGDGYYNWINATGSPLVELGRSYTINVVIDGVTYTANSTPQAPISIDSITYEPAEDFVGEEIEGEYSVQFWGRDTEGQMDYYWVKSYIDDVWANANSGQAFAIDGGYSEDGSTDGLTFIPPVRSSVSDTEDPIELGDVVVVEVHGIERGTWRFYTELEENFDNGGFFAIPYYNARCNFEASNGDENIVGWFSTSFASTSSILIE